MKTIFEDGFIRKAHFISLPIEEETQTPMSKTQWLCLKRKGDVQ